MPKKFMYHKQGIKKCADCECQAFALVMIVRGYCPKYTGAGSNGGNRYGKEKRAAQAKTAESETVKEQTKAAENTTGAKGKKL